MSFKKQYGGLTPEQSKRADELWPHFEAKARARGSVLSNAELFESFTYTLWGAFRDQEKRIATQLRADLDLLLAGRLGPEQRAEVAERAGEAVAANASLGLMSAEAAAAVDAYAALPNDQARARRLEVMRKCDPHSEATREIEKLVRGRSGPSLGAPAGTVSAQPNKASFPAPPTTPTATSSDADFSALPPARRAVRLEILRNMSKDPGSRDVAGEYRALAAEHARLVAQGR